MGDWLGLAAALLGAVAVPWIGLALLVGDAEKWRAWQAIDRNRRRRAAEVISMHRPLQQVSADLDRLRAAFGRGDMRFAKYEGCRQAYDQVLAEAADMVDVAHLLSVLPPGTELDVERRRVELLLETAGMFPRPRAA
jgi:hypothetical protein